MYPFTVFVYLNIVIRTKHFVLFIVQKDVLQECKVHLTEVNLIKCLRHHILLELFQICCIVLSEVSDFTAVAGTLRLTRAAVYPATAAGSHRFTRAVV